MATIGVATIKKLQKAINAKGDRLLYNTTEFYSEQQDRPVTLFIIRKAIWNADKQKNESVELFSSTSQVQIILFLRDYWYEMNGIEIPTDNEEWNKAKEAYYSKREYKASKKKI